MRASLRLLFAFLLVFALAVGCSGRRRGTGDDRGGTDGGGGGGTSCTQVCDNAVDIGTAEPDCMVDRAECDSMCPSYDETLKACLAAASSCDDMIACALAGCDCDLDSTCSSGCACDTDCAPPLDGGGGYDAGGGGYDAGGGGYDAGGGGYDAGGGGYDAGGGGGCTDTCTYAADGECDDGGPGSSYSVCELGTDCTDCGPR